MALDMLHNVITGKKRGIIFSWGKIHETIMLRHVELCVELKDHRIVKDGLHHYRNLCQNVISYEY
jgi:translation initiation factor 3 subunit A